MTHSPLTLMLAVVGELVVLALVVLDVLVDLDWPDGALTWLRVLAVAAAAATAVVAFQVWSTSGRPTPPRTAGMAAGLVGGASIAAAVTGADGLRVFGDTAFAVIGAVGMMLAVVSIALGQSADPKR
jgi:peptidoglycan/LPS O-acetylase OafA/YrhL